MNKQSKQGYVPVNVNGITIPEMMVVLLLLVWTAYGLFFLIGIPAYPAGFAIYMVAFAAVALIMSIATLLNYRGKFKAYRGNPIEIAYSTDSGHAYLTRVNIILAVSIILAVADYLMLYFSAHHFLGV